MEIERTTSYLEEILPDMGYVLDSVTFTEEAGTHYLRAFICRRDEEDMTVNDCAMVSRRVKELAGSRAEFRYRIVSLAEIPGILDRSQQGEDEE